MEAQRRTRTCRIRLAGLTVVELADDPGGEFSGALLAEMGAKVIKVEPPGGAPTRQVGPFANGEAGPETSLNFWYYNSGKLSVTLDLGGPAGLPPLLAPLLARADIFVCTLQPKALQALGLDLEALSHELFAPDRPGVGDRVRAHRSVGGLQVVRPHRPGRRWAAEQLRLRRPFDPADPARRQPGLPIPVASFAHIGVMLALLGKRQNTLGSASCSTSRCTRPVQ